MPQLAKHHRCTGCTACAAACPKGCVEMKADIDGFCYPIIDESRCIRCGLCENVCPVLNQINTVHTPVACAAKSGDDTLRMASTSGGVFPELARDVLRRGGAVFGAAYDESFRVIHICVEKEADLFRLQGAKYAQSDLGGSFWDVRRRLDLGQHVLFSGTPCQILGLKSFLKRDYKNLLLVDLVCHSVPSPLAWETYLQYISGEKTLTTVNLRCKDTGWSRYSYCNRFDFSDGTCRKDLSDKSLYMRLFGGGYISRPACSNCPAKGYARVSDLTLGDFWGIWDIASELDDNRGTSMVLVQTEKGRAAIARLDLYSVTLEEASRMNPAMLTSAIENPMHKQIMALVREGCFVEADQMITAMAHHRPSLARRMLGFLKRKIRLQ